MSQTSLPIRLASTSKDGNSATPQCLLKQTSPTSNASNLNSKITTTVDQTPISHSAAMVKQSLVMANASVTKPIILECEASHTLRRPSSSGLVSVPKTTKIDIRVSDVLTLASLRKSISLENTRPFRFSDLPPELREKAFKILLCNFKNIPKLSKDRQLAELHMKLFYLAHHNDYTILRANRAIYNEAQYAMRKSNLFVKVILNVRFGSERSPIETALISFRLPVMWLCVCHASDFSHSVLTHEISYAVNQEPAKPTIFVFLGRDMNRFVGALENFSFVTHCWVCYLYFHWHCKQISVIRGGNSSGTQSHTGRSLRKRRSPSCRTILFWEVARSSDQAIPYVERILGLYDRQYTWTHSSCCACRYHPCAGWHPRTSDRASRGYERESKYGLQEWQQQGGRGDVRRSHRGDDQYDSWSKSRSCL